MKKILLTVSSILTLSSILFAQQSFVAPRLQYSQGIGTQKGKFEGIGFGAQYQGFKTPTSKIGVLISYDWQLAGMETKRIDLNFGGIYGSTDVNYTSTMNKLTSGLVYAPMNGAFVTPYISAQAGFLWYRTKFYINDPYDSDFCRPEENRNVKMSFALAGNVESGVKVRLRKEKGRQLYAQAGVAYTIGSRARYIKLGDEPNDESTQSYTSKFKTSNGGTHAHSIGTMYRTNTSQLSYSLGLNFEFN